MSSYVVSMLDTVYQAEETHLEWIKKHCPSFITVRGRSVGEEDFYNITTNYFYDYYFSEEQDALAFKLKWAPQ